MGYPVKYCLKCLQPDTRPNIKFDDDGVCPACTYYDQLKHVDWNERYEILQDLFTSNPRSPGQPYDCIIGVSGGKDSTRQALWIRDKLKVNPLLVCLSYPPDQVSTRGTNNLSNLIELGFDTIVSSPAPATWKQLKKEGFDRFTNSWRSTELALFSCVPQIALNYGIKLILWGENPALQLGDMKTFGRTGYDGNNLRHSNTLSSGIDWILNNGHELKKVIPYQYPTPDAFVKSGLQIVFLGWFMGDWSLVNNALYSCAAGLEIREDGVIKTGDLHGVSSLDEDSVIVNQMIKYLKFGFGRVTDYVNESIRAGNLSREEGIRLIEKYDHCCDESYIKSYCSYLGISVEDFWSQVDKSINRELFEITGPGKFVRKFKVGEGL